jgi:hypothetical protein
MPAYARQLNPAPNRAGFLLPPACQVSAGLLSRCWDDKIKKEEISGERHNKE